MYFLLLCYGLIYILYNNNYCPFINFSELNNKHLNHNHLSGTAKCLAVNGNFLSLTFMKY